MTNGPFRVRLPELTPRQARLVRQELDRAADDPALRPQNRELYAWLSREITSQLRQR